MFIKLLIVVFSINNWSYGAVDESQDASNMRFSNTQTFDQYLFRKTTLPFKFIDKGDAEKISLKDYKHNNSKETKKELNLLLSLKKLRTLKRIKEIKDQRVLMGSPMCHVDLVELSPDDPILDLIFLSLADASVVIMNSKAKHDRVRPHFLKPEIQPIINVPRHPSYPSGHSTEAHLVAYILSTLDPQYKSCFLEKAARIALNREIAGLHYRSDTEAGINLADQIFNALKNSIEWNKKMDAAKISYIEKKEKMLKLEKGK